MLETFQTDAIVSAAMKKSIYVVPQRGGGRVVEVVSPSSAEKNNSVVPQNNPMEGRLQAVGGGQFVGETHT